MTDDVDLSVEDLDGEASDFTGRLVRPYAITGGRTEVDADLSLETQIQASTRAAHNGGSYRWEAAKLIDLVDAPMALVEISARLEIPIGVTRVLVSDLVDDGAIVVHVPRQTQNYTSLLEKVLDGVRNL